MGDHKTIGLDREQVHDVREALRTLTTAVEEIKTGYRFDDQFATKKLEYCDRAIKTLREVLAAVLV